MLCDCHRFTLSFRDLEDLLAERGVAVPYEPTRFSASQIRFNLYSKPAPLAWPAGRCLARGWGLHRDPPPTPLPVEPVDQGGDVPSILGYDFRFQPV